MNTDLFPLCGWCPANAPRATVRIVYEHPEQGCWCEHTSQPQRHVAWICEAHLTDELRELEWLGHTVVS